MIDNDLFVRLYTKWLDLARCCPAGAGADADEAVSAALDVAMKKPLKVEQAFGVFRTCLMRVRSRRLRQITETLVARRQLCSLPPGYEQPENAACGEVDSEEVHQAVGRLPPREQRVIRERYSDKGKPTPYVLIGRQEGVSGERIRQVERRALDHLRKLLESRNQLIQNPALA